MSLPSFGKEQDIVFKGDPKPSIHERKAKPVQKYTCELCSKEKKEPVTFTKKSSLTNHMKVHEKPLKDIYQMDYLQYETPQSKKMWDNNKESYVTGFDLPDGFKLFKIINLAKGVFHPVSGKAMTYSILLLERIKK